ncbi:MAG: peptidase [Acidimicrobiales bacterium]|nr:peptidase [Acidimicrobiales bacterium]
MRRAVAALIAIALTASLASTVASPAAAAPTFTARGSVNQVFTYGHEAGQTIDLLTADGTPVASGVADAQGAYLFKQVAKGLGYQVRRGGVTVSGLDVTDPADNPPDSFYSSTPAVNAGFGYITTRDGTTLSANVTMPKDKSTCPCPVVVTYSGYDPSQPGSPPQEATVYAYQGYVVVGVNMRGTTCSGGAFDFLEALQGTDGYDVVETLAHQPWSNGDVGMVGISYSGFSQLYVAATRPPHLRAITPLSPFADTYTGILDPGGILNDGFALDWATQRENDAKPAAHQWVKDRIANGDTTCAQNQVMRLQSRPLYKTIHDHPFADHQFDYLNPKTFVHTINVPTFLSSQWQDEQTGGSAAQLAPLFAPEAKLRANFTNGTHVEPEAPSEILEAMVFIDLYVGKRIPHTSSLLALGAPSVLAALYGSTDKVAFKLPYNPWASQPSYAATLAAYERQQPVRVRWENGTVANNNGSSSSTYGLPFAPVVTRFSSWPPASISAEKLYFQPDGKLAGSAPAVADAAARASSAYRYDPASKRNRTFDGSTDAAWTAHPDVHWNTLVEGTALSFLSDPYPKRAAYAGSGSVDLWLKSTAADTDLEATLTEVRPDGKEVFIQSGWLRASHRKLDTAASTELVPVPTHQAADAAPLPAGQYSPVRLQLFPFAHVIRPGSRLRVNIEAPGGNQDFWAFDTLAGGATNRVGHSVGMPSRVVLPRLPDSAVPPVAAALPPCTLPGVTTQAVSLRNQPCRGYLPARVPTAVQATPSGTGITVSWTAPPGPAPDGYRITPAAGPGPSAGGTVPAPVDVAGSATQVVFASVPVDTPLELTVQAIYGATPGPASDASLVALVSGLTAPGAVQAAPKRAAASVSWTAASAGGGLPVTGYRITPIANGIPQAAVVVASPATSHVVSGLTNGTPYTFTVQAINEAATGPASAPSAAVTPTPVRPFATVRSFVSSQLLDFTRSAPAAAIDAGVAAINGGQSAPDYIVGLRRAPDGTGVVDPVARLYDSYFQRIPDRGGLVHWIATRRSGTSLAAISAAFASSPEFTSRYGPLTNRKFVELVYTNVLGRPGDTGGLAYWTDRLDRRTATRGQVMVGFSESSEHVKKAAHKVDVVVVLVAMLDRVPTSGEYGADLALLAGGAPLSTLVADILDSPAYAARVGP